MDHAVILSDITNQAMVSVQTTPNAVLSTSNSKVAVTTRDSPDSGISFCDYEQFKFHAAVTSQSDALISSDYPFQFAIHADNLARSLACEFKVD